jgi:penicillin amidase
MNHRLLLLFIAILLVFCRPLVAENSEILQRHSDCIKIWQDETGMPHVVASSTYGAFYGYGYCLGRDRLFQLEVLRRSTEGTLAEVFGGEFVEADFLARRDRVAYDELTAGLQDCSEDFSIALSAFTAGINRSIEDVRQKKAPADPAFGKAGIKPIPFSRLQILDIFAGTMAARYNDFTMELDNLHFLNTLVRNFGARAASEIFDDAVFFEDPRVFTTLGDAAYFKPGFRYMPKISPAAGFTDPVHSPSIQTQKRNRLLKAIGVPDKSGSYGAALSMLDRGQKKALVFGGPQMGYFKPAAVYGIGLHTPDFDIVGTTPVGYPFMMFAANRSIAFTATAGVGNLVDLLAMKKSSRQENELEGHKCSTRIHARTEQIHVKGQAKPVLREVLDTDLGPVVAVEGDIYYVKHRAWKNRVVESCDAWFRSNFAGNLNEWLEVSDRNALSINWLAGDCDGNIAFVHCGLGKSRKNFGDDRLPVSSPTVFSAPDKRLAGVNPVTGFYANWNCPPVNGYRNGDLQTNWAADQRSRFLADHIAINKPAWSIDYLVQLDKDIAFTDQRAHFFKDLLVSFIDDKKLAPAQLKALQLLKEWDNRRNDDDSDGKYDSAAAGLFDALFSQVFAALFAEKLGDFAWLSASDPTWTQSAILAYALTGKTRHDYLGEQNPRELVTAIFCRVFAGLSPDGMELAKSDVMAMEFAGVNHVGAPTMTEPARVLPFMNRGSDIQIVELSPEGVKVFGCMPPGNSSSGIHETSQMDDFRQFRFRARPLLMKEVRDITGRFKIIRP